MPKRFIGQFALLTSLLVPTLSLAVDDNNRYAVKGLGLANCAQINQDENPQQTMIGLTLWVQGYITGLNQALPQTYDVASWADPALFANQLQGYCKQNPDQEAPVAALLSELVRSVLPDRLQSESEVVRPEANDKRVALYKTVLERAQTELKARGHYSGASDGLFGPKTQAAFESFQKQENLPVTGLPDQITLLKLFGQEDLQAPVQGG